MLTLTFVSCISQVGMAETVGHLRGVAAADSAVEGAAALAGAVVAADAVLAVAGAALVAEAVADTSQAPARDESPQRPCFSTLFSILATFRQTWMSSPGTLMSLLLTHVEMISNICWSFAANCNFFTWPQDQMSRTVVGGCVAAECLDMNQSRPLKLGRLTNDSANLLHLWLLIDLQVL